MNSEQGKAWQERAEAAERENERLHAVVQDLRDSLMSIRDETAFMDDPSMSITAMRNGATYAHGRADYALTKNRIGIVPCPMEMQCIPALPTCASCRAVPCAPNATEPK